MNHKKCIRCFEVKPIHVFEKKKRELNYRNICKTCRDFTSRTTNRLKRAHVREHGKPPIGTRCPICKTIPKLLVFDHCHETQLFRGWICRNCNAALGKLGDNSEGLQRALNYLVEFEARSTAVEALLSICVDIPYD